jgi:diguanylate cyclase (GGDEF)-like protein
MWQRNVIEETRQEKIHFQASHDDLTGLPNRALFHDRLTQALARMERNGTSGCILYLDLDDFKHVNDEFSHEAGDQVLKVIADRIQKCKRKTDTGARFSGDEFVILLENVNGSRNAASIAKKLLDTISMPIQIQDSEVIVSGSIGIAMIPQDGWDGSDILINADTAMYAAKSDGKNSISFFHSEMKEEMLHRIYLSKGMHRGLANSEFYLNYQPQYNAKTGEIFGAEALIRWQHPQLGVIPPREFIPIAEKNGMIIPMGKWVIEDVFMFHQSLASVLRKNIRLSANISGRQLRDDKFIDYLTTYVKNSGVTPDQLELEITETSVFENIEYTLSILKRLKSLGIRLAIDDFGTGYSSLSYLEKLPFDTVKIDIAFIRKITNLQVKLPILKGIISIANGMGLDVVAEGVENETQLDYLRSHGCHLVQGYYFNPSFSEQELLRQVLEQDVSKPRQSVSLKVAYNT